MTDRDEDLRSIERAAADLVPRLTERLRQHGLGEIEVRQGSLRVRVGGASPTGALGGGGSDEAQLTGQQDAATDQDAPRNVAASTPIGSPAVGYFVYGEQLGPGLAVRKGDPLGYVEMLGVRHEVRAPRAGTVRHLVAETGEAVEYGQLLVELEAVGG